MATHRDLSPWLSGLFVKPAAPGRGVGSALVQHLVREAARMDIAQLYLYTGTARGLYEKLGWREFWQEEYENLPVTAMSLAPGEGVSQTLTVGKPPGT